MEEKFATDEVRVQLAQDVLAQLEVGKLIGAPKGFCFIGFPYKEADKFYKELNLDLSEEGDDAFIVYEDPYEDEDEAAEELKSYLSIGARGFYGADDSICPQVQDMDLQEVLKRTETCTVCGIGSLVVAAAARYDNMKISLLENQGVFKAMANYFSEEQLHIIETVYERVDYNSSLHTATREKVCRLWPNIPTGTIRLRLIMENIIENNGRFVVPGVSSA